MENENNKELALKESFDLGQTLDFNNSMRIAKMFLESGYFQNEKSLAQVAVKIVAGAEFGLAPFSAMQSVNFIQGRPVVAAATQGSQAKKKGYSWKVVEHNDKICVLHFYRGAEFLGESSFSFEDAKKAGLAGKDNWQKWPRNMLFARAMSNGIKWFAPDTFGCAVYDPDELQAAGMSECGIKRMTAQQTQAIEVYQTEPEPMAEEGNWPTVEADEVLSPAVEIEKPRKLKRAVPVIAKPYVIQGNGSWFYGKSLDEINANNGGHGVADILGAADLQTGMTPEDLEALKNYK